MKKVFFVRYKRDNTPYLLVTVNAGGTDFQPLSDEADDVADVFDSVYKNRPINKQELDAALDDDFTIEGPINPTRGNLNLLQDFLADANQPLSPRKLAPSAKSFDISSVPLGFSDDDGKVNLTEYKARNFLYEQTKTTFNYEVKRVRAIWDPSLSIPGTGRRGGWRCPVGTRYGGQITDRFGRNCGWGVARRIANAITNIGERMESLDDRRRGRRVERRERRMLERLGRVEGEGRAERGLRNVAEALDGGEATPTPDVAPAPKAPRKPGRGVQARRRARNTTEALADARDRGLRDSERRRVRREIEEPNAPRTEQVDKRTSNDLNEAEEALLRKFAEDAKHKDWQGVWQQQFDINEDEENIVKQLVEKGYLKEPRVEFVNKINGRDGERQVWLGFTNKARRFFGVSDSRLMDSEEQVDKPKKPQAPRKRPRNARKPAKRPQGEARQDPTKPVGGPNETEDYAGYVNRKYDEYAENVRKIRERGGRAGFLTRREWYGINKRNLDDAWRKKGKGEAPDDFMPPTPAKKRRRQPGARKKPPVQDKEPTPNKPEPKKIEEEFPNQEPTIALAAVLLAEKDWKRAIATNPNKTKWKKGNWEITLEKDEDGDVFIARNPDTGEIYQVERGAVPLDQQLNQIENVLADVDADFPNEKPKTPVGDEKEPNIVEVARMKRQNDIIERATKEFDERIKKDLEKALGRPLTQQEEERMFDAFNNEMNKDWNPLDAYDNMRAILGEREGDAKQEVARDLIERLEEDWNNAEGDIRQILRDEVRAEPNDAGKLGALEEAAALEGRKQRFREAKKLWNDALKEQGGQEEGRTAKLRRAESAERRGAAVLDKDAINANRINDIIENARGFFVDRGQGGMPDAKLRKFANDIEEAKKYIKDMHAAKRQLEIEKEIDAALAPRTDAVADVQAQQLRRRLVGKLDNDRQKVEDAKAVIEAYGRDKRGLDETDGEALVEAANQIAFYNEEVRAVRAALKVLDERVAARRNNPRQRERAVGGDLGVNEEQQIGRAQFDANAQVEAVLNLANVLDVDSNAPAQLKRRYREVQQRLQDVLDAEKKNFDKKQKPDDLIAMAKDAELDAVNRVKALLNNQNEALQIVQDDKKTESERYAAVSQMVVNAAKLDGERQRIRQARKYKEDAEKIKAGEAGNPAADFRDVPFKVYAADATEPNKFMRDANDRGDARAELRLMVGEAAQRETKKWENGQRKKPKMMIMYHNGKAYVTEYDEFKKMTKAEKDAQIRKGIVVFDVNRGMSDTITRDAAGAREALEKLFDSDIPADELERGVKDLLDKYPDARKVDAGADADRELDKIRKDMHQQFKDFPDFRIIEFSDENNEKVRIAIADEDFRNFKRQNNKFVRNANVIRRKSGEIAPSRPRTNAPKPVDAEVKDIDPIGNPFKPKIDKRADVGIEFGDKGIGKYKPIVNPNIKNEADAIKFVKDGGDLSKVPHEYWHAAVKANASRGKVDKDKRFKIVSKNGGAIGDTRIYVFRDADGYGTNQGMVFKAADDGDNVGELIGWNFMHQVGILKGGAVGDGTNEGGKRYVILPFAFNDVPNGNKLTEFGGNPGAGNYPITEINSNISKQYKPQMFAARLNQELLNFALGVADRHRGNGVAKAVELPNGDHMAHIIPIDLGWGGRGVQNDPLMGGGVDDRFWRDLNRALGAADASQKARIQKSVIAAWDNMIDSLNRVLEGGEDEFVRDAVKNIDTLDGRRKAKKMYGVLTQQRARLISNRDALLRKIGA